VRAKTHALGAQGCREFEILNRPSSPASLLALGAELPLILALAVKDLHAVVVSISDCRFSRRARHCNSLNGIQLAVAAPFFTCANEDANAGAVERKL
jgi:hypothetical protein